MFALRERYVGTSERDSGLIGIAFKYFLFSLSRGKFTASLPINSLMQFYLLIFAILIRCWGGDIHQKIIGSSFVLDPSVLKGDSWFAFPSLSEGN